ncbi:unnamed protein product [Ectocarpus sp. 12 AP-2014]
MSCVRSGEKGTVVQEDGEAGRHHQVSVMRHANLKKQAERTASARSFGHLVQPAAAPVLECKNCLAPFTVTLIPPTQVLLHSTF